MTAQSKSVSEKTKRMALALAFGIVVQGGFATGIPGGVPGLSRALTCGSCVMKLSQGVPSQFAAYMSPAQKEAFKQAVRRKASK